MVFSRKMETLAKCEEDIRYTLNIKEIEFSSDMSRIDERAVSIKPVHASLGKKYRERTREVCKILEEQEPDELYRKLKENAEIKIGDFTITRDDVKFIVSYSVAGEEVDVLNVGDTVIAIPVHHE